MGVYLRYWQYYKRSRYIASLSNYNNDEIVEKIEAEAVQLMNEHRELIGKVDITKELETDYVMKLLSKRFPALRIQELLICSMIFWTKWDIGIAYYFEVVTR